MDIDALAREVTDRFMRADFAGPPLPPYFAHYMEHMSAEAERMRAEYPSAEDAPQPDWPPFESFEQDGYERIGDLDVYVYRIEPSASALLLALRGDALAYAAFAAMRFMGPADPKGRFPLYDLVMMATNARARGELDLTLGSLWTQLEGPIQVAFEIEPERYAGLDDGAAKHCIARARPSRATPRCCSAGGRVRSKSASSPRSNRKRAAFTRPVGSAS